MDDLLWIRKNGTSAEHAGFMIEETRQQFKVKWISNQQEEWLLKNEYTITKDSDRGGRRGRKAATGPSPAHSSRSSTGNGAKKLAAPPSKKQLARKTAPKKAPVATRKRGRASDAPDPEKENIAEEDRSTKEEGTKKTTGRPRKKAKIEKEEIQSITGVADDDKDKKRRKSPRGEAVEEENQFTAKAADEDKDKKRRSSPRGKSAEGETATGKKDTEGKEEKPAAAKATKKSAAAKSPPLGIKPAEEKEPNEEEAKQDLSPNSDEKAKGKSVEEDDKEVTAADGEEEQPQDGDEKSSATNQPDAVKSSGGEAGEAKVEDGTDHLLEPSIVGSGPSIVGSGDDIHAQRRRRRQNSIRTGMVVEAGANNGREVFDFTDEEEEMASSATTTTTTSLAEERLPLRDEIKVDDWIQKKFRGHGWVQGQIHKIKKNKTTGRFRFIVDFTMELDEAQIKECYQYHPPEDGSSSHP